jgi:hypothetical protein
MLYVSIFVELVRSRPALAVWLAALTQALIWVLVPSLFYSGPPGELPFVLAIGHELQLGTYLGPPLAFWLAEAAYDLAGGHLFGVYILSQICVVVTYWAVFALGRAIVGAQQAALAVLLMVGVLSFTAPTPDFGPPVLTMALWSMILLDYWRAVGEGSRGHWVALAIEIGLLLLTTYAGLLLIGLLALFTLSNKRARMSLRTTDPWFAVIVSVIVMFPHLLWMVDSSDGLLSRLSRLATLESVAGSFGAWLWQMATIASNHAGLLLLVAVVVGFPWIKRDRAPVIVRRPVDIFARQYVYWFAIMPALASTVLAILLGWSGPVGGIAPLVGLSGLAVILASGDAIELSHERAVIAAWFAVLLVPPAMTLLALVTMPWIGVDLSVNRPAKAMAAFFIENFERRVGAPPRIVAGSPRTAALVALGGHDARPSLLLDATPARSPWVTMNDVKLKGAIIVWPTTDTSGAPPPEIKARFPDIVPEVPRAFARPVQGRLATLRVGWAIVRPQ